MPSILSENARFASHESVLHHRVGIASPFGAINPSDRQLDNKPVASYNRHFGSVRGTARAITLRAEPCSRTLRDADAIFPAGVAQKIRIVSGR